MLSHNHTRSDIDFLLSKDSVYDKGNKGNTICLPAQECLEINEKKSWESLPLGNKFNKAIKVTRYCMLDTKFDIDFQFSKKDCAW